MSKAKIDPQLLLYGAGALAILFVVYKSTSAVGRGIDAVTSIPGKIGGAIGSVWDATTTVASDAWHSATDLFTSSSVAAGTTTSPRTVDPSGASFNELSTGSIDLFDPRYYGVQGNVILQAQTNQAGPGGEGQAVGSSANSGAFFSSSNPLGNMNGL